MSQERKKATATEGNERVRVLIELDQDFDDYRTRIDGFVAKLVDAMQCDPAAVQIIAVERGCILIELEGPQGITILMRVFESSTRGIPKEVVDEVRRVFAEGKVTLVKESPVGRAPAVLTSILAVDRVMNSGEQSVSWLHISDLHTRAADEHKHWGSDLVSSAFMESISALLNRSAVIPEFAVLSGDIAFSGRTAQYAEASRFIVALRAKVPSVTTVYVVPGNHDIHRPGVKDEDELRQQLNGVESTRAFLTSPDEETIERRRTATQRLANYHRFVEENEDIGLRGAKLSELSFTDVRGRDPFRVSITGLNTAWRSSSDSDKGKLILGEPQLSKARRTNEAINLRIGVSHHPLGTDWFAHWDLLFHRARLGTFDILLHGHEHTPGGFATTDLVSPSRILTIPCGALYLPPEDRDYYCSFNAVQFNLVQRRGCIWFWRFDRSHYRWVLDTGVTTDGFAMFDLGDVALSLQRHQ
jgi:predicted phosphodiesterase